MAKGSGPVVPAWAVLAIWIVLGVGVCAFAGMVILSILTTYLRNRSQAAFGDVYQCPKIMLKSLYADEGDTFVGGTIADNNGLNDLCSAQLASRKNFLGCVLQSGMGWGPYNVSNSTRRRRRAASTNGLYSLHTALLFFSNPCQKAMDKNKYAESQGLSQCVSKRLGYANGLVDANTPSFTQWSPVTGFILSIINTELVYGTIIPNQIFAIPRSRYPALASSLYNSSTNAAVSELSFGCRYLGQLPINTILGILGTTYTQPSATTQESTM